MANRRHGYGGRSYYNDGPVNPWQGGSVPGHNQGYNPVGSNLMSQISEPLPQLAVAITKLLQQSQQVPSLMSMDTVNPMRSSGGYRQNNDYGPRGRMEMHRRARHDMRFGNKMGGRNARDTDFNRRRDTSNKLNERKSQAHRTAALAKRNKASSAKTTPKTAGKGSGGKSKEPENADGTSADDTNNENDTKREEGDVKEEKAEGDEDGNAQSSEGAEDGTGAEGDQENADTTVDDDEQAADGEKKEDGEQGENQTNGKPKKKHGKTSLYDGIPRHLLRCRICMKKMWDGESFEKHMNGRTHQQMFEKVEESYRLKADMMRESIRLAEEKNSIEMMRMKRLGKKMKAQKVSRCAMCDLQFEGQLFMHRKSAGHQKLKHFLHPQCTYCNKEFPTRMEWENHRHTPEHFRKKAECTDRSDKHHDEDIHVEEDDFIDITFDDKDESEDANCLLDVPSDPYDIKSRIPSYNSKRAVGLSLIEETTGYYCKPCSRFFLSKATMEYHARTQLHYKSFVDILNEMQAECTGKHKITDEEDNEGNWKRRKVVKDDQDQDQDQDQAGEGNPDESKEEANEDGNALYDPADTFMATDANDVCVIEDEEQKNNCTGKDVDAVWNEVDQKLDEILEEKKDKEDKAQEQVKEEEQQQEEEEEPQQEDEQQFEEENIKQEPQEQPKQEVEQNTQPKQPPPQQQQQQKPSQPAQTTAQAKPQQQQKSPVTQQKPQQQQQKPPVQQQQKPSVQQQQKPTGGAPQKPQHPATSTPMKPGPMSKNVTNNAPPLAQRRTRGKRN